MMSIADELTTSLLEEAQEDELGLWSIIWEVRFALNNGSYPTTENDSADPAQVREITMQIVRNLLASEKVRPGYYASDGSGFTPWTLQVEDVVARITSEWDKLDREPDIGEVVIFVGES